jgi:hypothetical protein
LGPDVESLAQVADTGGGEAFTITGAGAWEQLVHALFAAADRHIPCTIEIPPPPQGESLDPGLVAVGYGAWGSSDVEEIPKLSRREDCELRSGAGWFFDEATTYSVHLCPSTCYEVQGSWVSLVFGCPPESAP